MTSLIPGDPSFKFLSGASGGSPEILLTATTSGGAQTIHTAGSAANDIDYVTIWAANIDGTTSDTVTLELAGQQYGPFTVASLELPVKLLDGIPMNNSTAITAYASAASKIVLSGKAIRIVDGAL